MAKIEAIRNRAKKILAGAMKKETKKKIEKLCKTPNNIFKFLKYMKKDGGEMSKVDDALEMKMEDWASLNRTEKEFGKNTCNRS